MQGAQGIRPANLSANQYQNYPFRSSSLNSFTSPSPTTSWPSHHATLSDDTTNPSHQTSSHTSWETSWFHEESRPPSIFDHDESITLDSDTTQDDHTAMVDSCSYEPDDWFASFRGDLDISDEPPTPQALATAGDIPVYDAAGNSRLFKSLFAVGDVFADRQLIIFIRHFFCGACQAYIKALTKSISMRAYFSMAKPTSIIVIGCGSPELIRQYKANTQCPFPIFADPTRQVFKNLGMGITLDMFGSKRPQYMEDIGFVKWQNGQFREFGRTKGTKKFKFGNLLQVGGEFLFQNGEVVWCHRMRNMRGHAEVDVIKRILEMET